MRIIRNRMLEHVGISRCRLHSLDIVSSLLNTRNSGCRKDHHVTDLRLKEVPPPVVYEDEVTGYIITGPEPLPLLYFDITIAGIVDSTSAGQRGQHRLNRVLRNLPAVDDFTARCNDDITAPVLAG